MASTLFYFEAEETCGHGQENHFLEACSMCQRPLNLGRDIFMYKGNSAFCSLQCRQEQIEIDNRPWQPKKSSTGWDLSASWQAIRTAAAAVSWIQSSATTAAGASTATVTVDPEYFWF